MADSILKNLQDRALICRICSLSQDCFADTFWGMVFSRIILQSIFILPGLLFILIHVGMFDFFFFVAVEQ